MINKNGRSIFLSHTQYSILTQGRPVPVLTSIRKAYVRVTITAPTIMSLERFVSAIH